MGAKETFGIALCTMLFNWNREKIPFGHNTTELSNRFGPEALHRINEFLSLQIGIQILCCNHSQSHPNGTRMVMDTQNSLIFKRQINLWNKHDIYHKTGAEEMSAVRQIARKKLTEEPMVIQFWICYYVLCCSMCVDFFFSRLLFVVVVVVGQKTGSIPKTQYYVLCVIVLYYNIYVCMVCSLGSSTRIYVCWERYVEKIKNKIKYSQPPPTFTFTSRFYI